MKFLIFYKNNYLIFLQINGNNVLVQMKNFDKLCPLILKFSSNVYKKKFNPILLEKLT